MKIVAFFRKIIIFFLLFFIANKIANQLYIELVLSRSYLYRMEHQFNQNKEEIQVLVAGDLHPISDFHPLIINHYFVAATSGENMIQTYYRLKYYLEGDILSIKLVILPIDFHSFSSFRIERYENPEYWGKYINYLSLGFEKHDFKQYFGLWLDGEMAYVGKLNQVMQLIKIKTKFTSGENEMIKGFMVREDYYYLAEHPNESAVLHANKHLGKRDHMHPEAVDYFFRILELLKENEINVVLVRYPISKQYYSEVVKLMDIDNYDQQIKTQLTENDYRLPILDYHDLYFNEILVFSDPDHLNVNGAIKFTKTLKQDLKSLGLYP